MTSEEKISKNNSLIPESKIQIDKGAIYEYLKYQSWYTLNMLKTEIFIIIQQEWQKVNTKNEYSVFLFKKPIFPTQPA